MMENTGSVLAASSNSLPFPKRRMSLGQKTSSRSLGMTTCLTPMTAVSRHSCSISMAARSQLGQQLQTNLPQQIHSTSPIPASSNCPNNPAAMSRHPKKRTISKRNATVAESRYWSNAATMSRTQATCSQLVFYHLIPPNTSATSAPAVPAVSQPASR